MKKQEFSFSNGDDKQAKKPKHLGDFVFAFAKKINSKESKDEIGKVIINDDLRCEGCFKKGFRNSQGLGFHQATCKRCQQLKAKERLDSEKGTPSINFNCTIFTNPHTQTPRMPHECNNCQVFMTWDPRVSILFQKTHG